MCGGGGTTYKQGRVSLCVALVQAHGMHSGLACLCLFSSLFEYDPGVASPHLRLDAGLLGIMYRTEFKVSPAHDQSGGTNKQTWTCLKSACLVAVIRYPVVRVSLLTTVKLICLFCAAGPVLSIQVSKYASHLICQGSKQLEADQISWLLCWAEADTDADTDTVQSSGVWN